MSKREGVIYQDRVICCKNGTAKEGGVKKIYELGLVNLLRRVK